jgi:UrcA family protein
MNKILWTAAAVLFGTSPLQAMQAPANPTAVTVSYTDLDLSHPEGRSTLEDRLRAAARSVCRYNVATSLDRIAIARCRRETLALARNSASFVAAQAERRPQLAQHRPMR